MVFRRHFPSLLVNSKDLFLLAIYETLISVFCEEGSFSWNVFLLFSYVFATGNNVVGSLGFSTESEQKSVFF